MVGNGWLSAHEISSLSQNYTTEFPKAKERLVPF
jgi:hypothetical protein